MVIYTSYLVQFNLGIKDQLVIQLPGPFKLADDVPLAQELYISRIANPASQDKIYFEECLIELQKWLQTRKKILHKGDIIVVKLNGIVFFIGLFF
jgi:hypothetical protein